jgi:hypothetical protein
MAKKPVPTFVPTTSKWALFLAIAHFAKRMILHSIVPGTGKSTAGLMLAEATDAECILIPCMDTLTMSDLLGFWMPTGQGKFLWHDGPAARAVRLASEGKRVVLVWDELNYGSPDAHQVAHALGNRGKSATFTLPNNEVFSIPENLVIIITQNPDPSETLTDALLSRFPVRIDIGSEVSPMILAALPTHLRSMVADGRLASREAFALVEMVDKGCDPFIAVQAILGDARTADYGDALAIALS